MSTRPTILFLHEDPTDIDYAEVSHHWLAAGVGFRSLVAGWRSVVAESKGVTIESGYEAVSHGRRRWLATGIHLRPDAIVAVHPRIVGVEADVFWRHVTAAGPGAWVSYDASWRRLTDKWNTELMLRASDARSVVARPRTHLVETSQLAGALRDLGANVPLIFKPSGGAGGQGIHVSTPETFSHVAMRLSATHDSFVVQ